MSSEILAPAGSPEMLKASVRAGADAVYFGIGKFNARRNAENFTPENIGEYVEYCHRFNVKTYLTLNTLVSDVEFEKALEIAKVANEVGIDAVLVQDMGLVTLLKKHYPDLPLHASTQMAVHNVSGLEFLSRLGFSRVVLARENSKEEIKAICDRAKQLGVEIEVFVQGALCMCVSGQCLMSASLGGRSGNRGLCAGTCRLPFSVKGGECEYSLSLKDLSLLEEFEELEKIGVKSFKIEGRMKRPEYAAAAVSAAVSARDNRVELVSKLAILQSVFSRNGFTKAYYNNKLDSEMFGVRSESDIESSRRIYSTIHELYRTEPAKIPIKISFVAKSGENEKLTFSDGTNSVTLKGEIPEIANFSQTVVEQLRVKLSKLGGTGYYAESVDVTLDDGLRVIDINSLKTKAVEQLTKLRVAPPKRRATNFKKEQQTERSKRTPKLVLNVHSKSQIPSDLADIFAVILPMNTDDETIKNLQKSVKFIVKTPPAVFNETVVKTRLDELKKLGVKHILAENIGSIELIKNCELIPVGGATLNCFNSLAIDGYGLTDGIISREMSYQGLQKLSTSANIGVEIYGRTPMMTVRSCPIKARVGCKNCTGHITDRRGSELPVMCEDGVTRIYNDRPTWLCDRTDVINLADYCILSFTTETVERVVEVISAYKGRKPADCEFTRGMLINKVK